jgi:hypothetical protein
MASLAMARIFQGLLGIISGIFSYGHLEKFGIPRGPGRPARPTAATGVDGT